jgi:hypothetical protein
MYEDPQFAGYSIGQWVDEDGDGHKDSIHWHYRCFDRILLKGLIQPFQQPERVLLNTYRQLYPVSRRRCSLTRATSPAPDWVSNPVLRFAEHPDVVPVVVQRLEEPSTGAGEE